MMEGTRTDAGTAAVDSGRTSLYESPSDVLTVTGSTADVITVTAYDPSNPDQVDDPLTLSFAALEVQVLTDQSYDDARPIGVPGCSPGG